MFVHCSLVPVKLNISNNNIVGVYLRNHNVHILTVYRPPSNQPLDDALLLPYLNDYVPGKEIIIMGEFNLACIQGAHDQSFLDCFTSLCLHQWITEPTNIHSNNTSDLIFTSDRDRIVDIRLGAPLPNCEHLSIMFSYLFETDVPTPN